MVINERIYQNLRDVEEAKKNIFEKVEKFKCFQIEINKKIFEIDFKKNIKSIADEFIEKNEINIIKTPKITQKTIDERVLLKKFPFSQQQSNDKGYKDTIIWLSLLADAKTNKDTNYVLMTDNKNDFNEDFLKKEFKTVSNKEFKIISQQEDLKIYLDEKFNLNLKIKDRDESIKQELYKNIGTITKNINAYIYDSSITSFGSLTNENWFNKNDIKNRLNISNNPYLINTMVLNSNKNVIGLNFSGNIDFFSIEELEKEDKFLIRTNIILESIYQNNRFNFNLVPDNEFTENYHNFNLNIYYDNKNKKITLIDDVKMIY